MNHHDAEITDVLVVMDDDAQKSMDPIVARLKELGLEIVEVNAEEGVIEGSIDSSKVAQLKTVPGVSYVRSVFTYTADYPVGDPRDLDGPAGNIEEDEDE